MNKPIYIILHTLFLALLISAPVRADEVVVVSVNSNATMLNRREAINIFMGRYRFFPSGHAAKPYDLPKTDSGKALFYLALTGKDISDIDAYWARLVLTGHASPPDEVLSQEAMLEKIYHNPRSIGYLDRSRLDNRVRVIFDPEH